ncbi:phosphoenolpyruvate-utilizing N-terminal domain-containing protein, partial [Mycolicibacterium sphagni]
MTASSTPTSHGAGPVLTGVPVVPGVRYAPVIRPGRLPAIEDLDPGGDIADGQREAEATRFTAAAATVAGRLRERAAA